MKTEKTGKLFSRVIVIHTISAVFLMGAITVLLCFLQYRNLNKEMMRSGRLAVTHVSIAGVDPIVQTLAYDRISEIINSMLSASPHLKYIVVYNLVGDIVDFCGQLEDKQVNVEKISDLYKTGRKILVEPLENGETELYRALSGKGDFIGFVRIGLSSRYIRNHTLKSFFLITGIGLVILSISIACFFIFLDYHLGRPLEETVLIMDSYSKHSDKQILYRIQEALSHQPDNEIGMMTKTFGRLVEKVETTRSQLEKSNALLFNLLQSASEVAIISAGKNGIVTIFNRGAEKMLGYSEKEIVGKKPVSFFHLTSEVLKREKELTAEFGFSVKKNEVFSIKAHKYGYEQREWTYVKKDGSHICVSLVVNPVKSSENGTTAFLGIAVDITEKKKAEMELLRAKKYIDDIFDSMPSILIGVDSQGRVTRYNRSASLESGITLESVKGRRVTRAFSGLAFDMDQILQSIEHNRTTTCSKRARKTKTGLLYEDFTIYPLISGAVKGAVLRLDNVTEKVRMEEMMIQSEKMLSVGGLAAGMAHELNNPLAGMIQTADVLRNRLTRKIPASVKVAQTLGTDMETINAFLQARGVPEMLDNIHGSGLKAAEIVRNMLSFARKGDASKTLCSLADLLDETLSLAGSDYDLKKKYDFRQIEIIRHFQKDLPHILCEPGKLQQVFLNILTNRAHAMFSFSKECTQQHDPQFTLTLALDTDPSRVIIEIRDNGPGMDRETAKRVFEPFFTTKKVGEGTGLGLSVSFFIVTENHGGEMTVKSDPGRGSAFIIKLPV